MDKSPEAFRSIGEVSRLVGVAPHVLRYWETQFSQLSPVKRGDGRRYYRPDDVRLVAGLCQVMREEGLSIRGAKRLIATDRGAGLRRTGAARLGELQMAELTAATPAPAGADALPVTAPIATQAATTQQITDVSPATPKRRRPQDAPLPLFADMDPSFWLLRLSRLAAKLRCTDASGTDLTNQAQMLRDRLLAAR